MTDNTYAAALEAAAIDRELSRLAARAQTLPSESRAAVVVCRLRSMLRARLEALRAELCRASLETV